MPLDEYDAQGAEDARGASDEDKVDVIYIMIREFRWHDIKSARELGHIWRMRPQDVMALAARAHHLFSRDASKSAESLAHVLVEQLNHVVSSAMAKKKHFVTKDGELITCDDPDHKAAIAGIKQIAEVSGAKMKQAEVNYNELTLVQLVELAKEHLPKALNNGSLRLSQQNTIDAPGEDAGVPADLEYSPSGDGRSKEDHTEH